MTHLTGALLVGALFASGSWLVLRRSPVRILVGLTLLSHGANVFLFTAAGPLYRAAPLVTESSEAAVADPLPQALILTAIVISFALTVFAVVVTHRVHEAADASDVDSLTEPER
jgi:multicomponent Na+:H+ antiporter subunit C